MNWQSRLTQGKYELAGYIVHRARHCSGQIDWEGQMV